MSTHFEEDTSDTRKMQKCFPTLSRDLASCIFRINRMTDFKNEIRKFDLLYSASLSKWEQVETYHATTCPASIRYIFTKSIVYHGGFKLMDIASVYDEDVYTVSRYLWHPDLRSYEYYQDGVIDRMFDDESSDYESDDDEDAG
jgi:hypothetical protein